MENILIIGLALSFIVIFWVYTKRTTPKEELPSAGNTKKGDMGLNEITQKTAVSQTQGDQTSKTNCKKTEENNDSLIQFHSSVERQSHPIYGVQLLLDSRPFLTSELLAVDSKITVPYSIASSEVLKYPYIVATKRGTKIKAPVNGRTGLRGKSEEMLCDVISAHNLSRFYDNVCLFARNKTYPYSPDLVYIDADKGIFVDIEVDEPYDGINRNPIHYKLDEHRTVDDERNKTFIDRGWTVIRFSEKQVFEHTESCLREIYKLLNKMNHSIMMPSILAQVEDIESEDMWTIETARSWAKDKYRENYLKIDHFAKKEKGIELPAKIQDSKDGIQYEESLQKKITTKEPVTPARPSTAGILKSTPIKDAQTHSEPSNKVVSSGSNYSSKRENTTTHTLVTPRVESRHASPGVRDTKGYA